MYQFKADIPVSEFTEFIENSSFAPIQQTVEWTKLKNNWKNRFCGVYKDETLIGVALILIRTLMPGFNYAYCPRGPIMDLTDIEAIKAFRDGAKEFCKKNNIYSLKTDPAIVVNKILPDIPSDKFFDPFVGGFKYAESGNTEQFLEMADDTVCAIILEVVQGEGGVVPTDFQYLKTVEKVCKEKDILLIIDEVQTGMGRTGKLFAYEHAGISPDVITSAKGIGNGLPMGACLCTEKCANVLTAGTHGTTFGGNPVACAGAKYILETMTEDFLNSVTAKGDYIREKLAEIPEVGSVTGLGMMIGIELKTKNAGEIAKKCSENGLLILTAKNKLRMLPPLVITKEEIDKGIAILKSFLED